MLSLLLAFPLSSKRFSWVLVCSRRLAVFIDLPLLRRGAVGAAEQRRKLNPRVDLSGCQWRYWQFDRRRALAFVSVTISVLGLTSGPVRPKVRTRQNGHRDKFRCYHWFHDQGRSSDSFENLRPDFRNCLMIDLGRETDGNNEICVGVHFALCVIKAQLLACDRIEHCSWDDGHPISSSTVKAWGIQK